MGERGQMDVIYTYFQKAFDQINHFVHLSKLYGFGFSFSPKRLLHSSLLGRENRSFFKRPLQGSPYRSEYRLPTGTGGVTLAKDRIVTPTIIIFT